MSESIFTVLAKKVLLLGLCFNPSRCRMKQLSMESCVKRSESFALKEKNQERRRHRNTGDPLLTSKGKTEVCSCPAHQLKKTSPPNHLSIVLYSYYVAPQTEGPSGHNSSSRSSQTSLDDALNLSRMRGTCDSLVFRWALLWWSCFLSRFSFSKLVRKSGLLVCTISIPVV